MGETLTDEAKITMTVNFTEGRQTGKYVFIIANYQGKEIYRHTIETIGHNEAPVFDYINNKFTNSNRFKNLRATFEKATGIFTYYGIDMKKMFDEFNNSNKSAEQVNMLGEPYYGDVPEEFINKTNEQNEAVNV